MEYTTVLGVWAVAVTGPCVISWLAGDMVGSSRTRRLFGESSLSEDKADAKSALRVEEWRVRGSVHPLPPVEQDDPNETLAHTMRSQRDASFFEQAAAAELRHQERAALARVVPAALEQEPSVVIAPDYPEACESTAKEALDYYARSVDALVRFQRPAYASELHPRDAEDALRLSPAAPAVRGGQSA